MMTMTVLIFHLHQTHQQTFSSFFKSFPTKQLPQLPFISNVCTPKSRDSDNSLNEIFYLENYGKDLTDLVELETNRKMVVSSYSQRLKRFLVMKR